MVHRTQISCKMYELTRGRSQLRLRVVRRKQITLSFLTSLERTFAKMSAGRKETHWEKTIALRTVNLQTGIHLRIAENGRPDRPLVLFLHGWPESWFSWRHQLEDPRLASRFYLVAPDLRGYGGSSCPWSPAEYTIYHIASDLLLLLEELGQTQCIVVGHDWGALLAWMLLALYPRVFRAGFILSVPYAPWTTRNPLKLWKELYGENFFYILYHNELPNPAEKGPAETEYDQHCPEFLYRIYSSPLIQKDPPRCMDTRRSAGGWLDRLHRPQSLPHWLSQDELDYFVEQFTSTGFRGGVNYYRNFEANWYLMAPYKDQSIAQPITFVAGAKDPVLAMFLGQEHIEATMRASLPQARMHFLEDCGHWTQQEKPAEVNDLLLEFVQLHASKLRAAL